MHRISVRKTSSAALLMGGSIAATSAFADTPQGGYGMGPGMMGGYGQGPEQKSQCNSRGWAT